MKPESFASNYQAFIKASRERYSPDKAKERSTFEQGSTFLKKVKFVQDSTYAFLYPLELVLPFDPETLSTEVFNNENPLPLPGSPTTAANQLRAMAKDNPEFAEKLAEVLDTTIEKLKLDSTEFDASDIRLWHKLARIQFITGWVQHLNTKKETFKFGRTVGCKPVFDEDRNVVGTEGVGARLVELETALISIKIQKESDSYKDGGKNADRPDSELEQTIKKLWKDRLIGNPYQVAFVRICAFTDDTEYAVAKGETDVWNKSKRIKDFSFYQKITRDNITLLERSLSSRNSDIHMDFLETVVTVPKSDDGKTVQYIKITYVPATPLTSIFMVDPDTDQPINKLEGFEEAYTTLRDDPKQWSEETLHKSIFEFRVPSDSTLLSEMKNSLDAYEDAMNSSELTGYSDILDKLDSTLTEKIALQIMDSDDDVKISPEIVASAPVDNENNTSDEFEVEGDLAALLDSLPDTDTESKA